MTRQDKNDIVDRAEILYDSIKKKYGDKYIGFNTITGSIIEFLTDKGFITKEERSTLLNMYESGGKMSSNNIIYYTIFNNKLTEYEQSLKK